MFTFGAIGGVGKDVVLALELHGLAHVVDSVGPDVGVRGVAHDAAGAQQVNLQPIYDLSSL